MPRCGNLRRRIQESTKSIKAETASFVLPLLILLVEFILLEDAWSIGAGGHIIFLIIVLLVVSLIELILVSREIYTRRQEQEFDRCLTIKLDDYIIEAQKINVKEIVTSFIEQYPLYKKNRSQLYKITCQILQAHKDKIFKK